ncbi:hypothetical protein DSM100685_0179 [Bifidobacterium avesanii]|nr:hypothetical protein DSM100685_0179 [Bifidobacterium avesanii]
MPRRRNHGRAWSRRPGRPGGSAASSGTAPQWPLGAVWRQVWRTVACQPGFVLLLVVLVAVASGGLAYAEAGMRADAFDYQSRLTAAGRYVYKASARTETGEGLISAAACANLNYAPGVRAAAGFTGGQDAYVPASVNKAPGEYLTVRTAVGDPVRVIDPSSPGRWDEGFYIDSTLAARLGVYEGMNVALTLGRDGGERTVGAQAHLIGMSARGFDQSQTLYVIGPAVGMVAECLVEYEPGAYGESARQALMAALDDGRTIVSVAPLLGGDANAVPPLDQYRARVSRYFWAVSGVVCFLVAFVPLVFRRHEFALYRSVGAGSGPTALVYAFANGLVLLAGHAAGLLWMLLAFLWVRRVWPPTPGVLAGGVGASFLLALALVVAGCVVLSRGNMATYIQKRL